jgi:hypothetical protein
MHNKYMLIQSVPKLYYKHVCESLDIHIHKYMHRTYTNACICMYVYPLINVDPIVAWVGEERSIYLQSNHISYIYIKAESLSKVT